MDTLSAAEVGCILQLNVKRVRSLARAGRLPAVRVGRKWRFSRRRVEALLYLKAEPEMSHSVELSARNQLRGRIVAPEFQEGVDRLATGQFEISDERSPAEIATALRGRGFETVWKDWDQALLQVEQVSNLRPGECKLETCATLE